jgi:hypothetical protein
MKHYPSESNYTFAGNSPIVMIDVDGKFKIPIHQAILNEALSELCMESSWNADLLYGVGYKADIGGFFDDNHFDSRTSLKKIDESWIKLNQQITITINTIQTLNEEYKNSWFTFAGITRRDMADNLGVLIHNVQDFYAHSNYTELYIEYYKSQNNGAMPTTLPIYSEGVKIEGFKVLMERTTYDKNGKYEGLYTGEFDISENEFWDVKMNNKNKSTIDPDSHANTNHDYADTPAGKLARGAAKENTKQILKQFKKTVGPVSKGESNPF